MKSNEYKPTHGGYPPQKSRPGSRGAVFTKDGRFIRDVFLGCRQWTADEIMESRKRFGLVDHDAAIAQFATFAKLCHQHQRLGDEGQCCGSE